jgi:CubicO group peptidase (beta-lactamase class C family)
MHEVMAGHVDSGEVPGMVTLLARRGEVHVEALGTLAADGPAGVRRDSIFRIASMTKPVTAAAAMILVEECTLRLDDPVDPWLPELADRRVLRAPDADVGDTVPASRPISLRDLLTLRAGFGFIPAPPGTYPIQAAIEEAGVAPGPDIPDVPPDELLRRYAGLPLFRQPGDAWLYHSAADVLGILVARASGAALGDFLRERLFEPLGMKDTGFFVPPRDVPRLATGYRRDHASGELVVFDEAAGGRFSRQQVFESGGSGLVSTADDYLAFLQMLLAGGSHQGRRILSRRSVELMTMNHLTPEQQEGGAVILGENQGWGFGMAVQTRRHDLWGTPGRFGWDGGYGTSAYADPREGLVGILLTQRMMDSPQPPPVFRDFWTSAYAALHD